MAYSHPSTERYRPLDFWVVTMIDNVYRPLAGVRRYQPYTNALEVPTGEVSATLFWIKTILSDPANRINIETERAMAIDFYRVGFRVSANPQHQFPFVVECLLLGACHYRSNDLYTQRTTPLPLMASCYDLFWRRGNIVVFDITNLNDLRGGIMLPNLAARPPYHLFSAVEFAAEFGYIDAIGDTRTLEYLGPIDPSVVNFTRIFQDVAPIMYNPDGDVFNEYATALISRTVDVNVYDEMILEILRRIANLKDLLQQYLSLSEPFGRTPSAGQIIGIAFSGEAHVDLVRFKGISVEALRFAFETRDMSNTRSLILCVDNIQGSGVARRDAVSIMNAICKLPCLQHLYCFQEPGRNSCAVNREFYKLVIHRASLLQRMDITFNTAFSLSLNDMPWVELPQPGHPPSAYHPSSEVVPVQHMFIRRYRPAGLSQTYNIDWYTSYYLAHGLLRAETFAAKFLRYLWQPPGCLAAFSAGPPSLTDMSGIEVRPLLEWNSLMGISEGAWVLLLSIEGKTEVRVVKYALVRMNGDSYKKFTPYRASVTPSEIDVVGLKRFLEISAPAVEPALIDRALAEATRHMATWVNEADQSPELERLSVMDFNEAVTMLNECLENAYDFKDATSSSKPARDLTTHWYLPKFGGNL